MTVGVAKVPDQLGATAGGTKCYTEHEEEVGIGGGGGGGGY